MTSHSVHQNNNNNRRSLALAEGTQPTA